VEITQQAQRNNSGETRRRSRVKQLAAGQRARRVGAVLTGTCGVTALVSASGKLTRQAAVVELLDHVEVYGLLRDLLPILQIAGGLAALGSLARYPRIGVVALSFLALYFIGAVLAHLRVGDGPGDLAIPLGYAIAMAVAAVLRGATMPASTQSSTTR
jgi:hypothetical protein